MEIFKNQLCTANTSFLNNDRFTFSVLIRILKGECAFTLVNDDRLIICHSCAPYPVWVWLANDASEEEMDRAYLLTKEHLGISGNAFDLKYEVANYFIKRAKQDGYDLKINTNMLAYCCEKPIAPQKNVSGYFEIAGYNDIEEVTEFIIEFHEEAHVDIHDYETYRQKAMEYIDKKSFVFWNDGNRRVACCACREMKDQSSIGAVYTKSEHRRKGYASHLLYSMAERIIKNGKTPSLYTDADYSASNSCYTKIGFKKMGALCAIGE